MKRLLSLLLVFVLSLGMVSSMSACNKQKKDRTEVNAVLNNKSTLYQGEDAKLSETPLSNAYKLLTTDKKLTLGFIGGSITHGGSAAKMDGSIEKSYVNLISKWFSDNYPDATIETVNAGVSDTATNFGIFRLEKTLMNEQGHDMPDVVFVEFTSNDWIYDTQTIEDLKAQIESLFLNIWKHNPYAEIVAVITNGSDESVQRTAYKTVCDHYGIPTLDVGIVLRNKIKERIGKTEETDGTYYYTTDNLHPSHYGYAVYMTEIEKFLISNCKDIKTESKNLYPYEKNLPNVQNDNLILNPKILTADSLEYGAVFKKLEVPFNCDMYNTGLSLSKVAITDNYLTALNRGVLNAEFTGNTFGIMFRLNKSGVNMIYSIDGGKNKTLKIDSNNFGWQMYDHPQVFMLAQNLSEGKHTVKITFLPIDASNNVNIVLGGLLINEE